MFDDLVKQEKEKRSGIECPVCKEHKVRELGSTEERNFTYRHFECEGCCSKFSIRSLGI